MQDPKEIEIQAKFDKCKKEIGELSEVFNKNMTLMHEYHTVIGEVAKLSERAKALAAEIKRFSDAQPKFKELAKLKDSAKVHKNVNNFKQAVKQKDISSALEALIQSKKNWESIVAKIDAAYPDPIKASDSLKAKSNQMQVELDSVKQLLASLNKSSVANFMPTKMAYKIDKVTGEMTFDMDKETAAIFEKQVTMQTIYELKQREITAMEKGLDLYRTHFTKEMPLLPQDTRASISYAIVSSGTLINDSAKALLSFNAALDECLKEHQNILKSTDPKIAGLYSSTSPALHKQPPTPSPDGKRESSEPEKLTSKMSSLTLGGTS